MAEPSEAKILLQHQSFEIGNMRVEKSKVDWAAILDPIEQWGPQRSHYRIYVSVTVDDGA
jgi:hypothetical protein